MGIEMILRTKFRVIPETGQRVRMFGVIAENRQIWTPDKRIANAINGLGHNPPARLVNSLLAESDGGVSQKA